MPSGETRGPDQLPSCAVSYRTDDLYTIAPDGSGMTLRSTGLDRDPSGLVWAPDSKALYFTAVDRGTSNLWLETLGAAPKQLTTGTHMLGSAAVTRNGVVFAVRSNYSRPPDIVRLEAKKPAELTQLTDVNADLLTGTRLAEVEEFWYGSSG